MPNVAPARARWLCVLAASRLEAQRHRPAFKRATYFCRSTEPRSPGPMISLSCSAPNRSDAKRWLASYAVASSNELRFRPLIAAARERFPFFAHLRQGARMRRPAQPPKRIDGLLKAASLRSCGQNLVGFLPALGPISTNLVFTFLQMEGRKVSSAVSSE